MTEIPPAPSEPFGSVFAPQMSVARFDGAVWSAAETVELDSFSLHPGTHALHYGSSCFEGLKAHRQPDGSVRSFRPDAHVARLRQSAARLCLPVPPAELATELIELAVAAAGHLTPASPGALYVRPTMLGTDITIGSAAAPSATAMLFVLACPVGEYLPPGRLTVAVETVTPRTTPQFGVVKTGANYAMALAPIMEARRRSGADQVLFAPGGVVQETGASNVLLLDGDELLTPALTDGYLHGVTRDSLLRVARSIGLARHRARGHRRRLSRVDRPARRRAGAHRHGGDRCRRRHARGRRRRPARRHQRREPAHRAAARRAAGHPDRSRHLRLVTLRRHCAGSGSGIAGSGRSGLGGTIGLGWVGPG